MRQLTKNEKRYIVVLALISFLMLNFLGLRFFRQKKEDLQDSVDKLNIHYAAATEKIKDKEEWAQIRDWIQQHQPKFGTDSEAEGYLVDLIRNSTRDKNVQVMTSHLSSIDRAETSPFFKQKHVPFMVTGTLESITRWLAELQQPEKFIAVRINTLKSTQEPPKVECDLEVALCYQLTRTSNEPLPIEQPAKPSEEEIDPEE